MNRNITLERAARRHYQSASIERELVNNSNDIASAKDHLKELLESQKGLIRRLRSAARDEGELPLFADADDDAAGGFR